MEGKLDSISQQVNGIAESIKALTTTVNNVETSFDRKLEDLKEKLEKKIEDTIEGKKLELKTELRTEIDADLDLLRSDLTATKMELSDTKNELARIRAIVETPYNPAQSVVIYGLRSIPEEDIQDTVRWLFSTILQTNATIVNAERIEPRGTGQIGVVRVELACTQEKIAILRAKRRCLEHGNTKDVIIRTCDNHDMRVNKLNCRKILSMMPGGREFIVADNGVIKKKPNIPGGGDGAAITPGDDDEMDPNTQATTVRVSDNGAPRGGSAGGRGGSARGGDGSQRNNFGNPRGGSMANQHPRPYSVAGNDSHQNNNNAGQARGGARGGGNTGRGGAPGGGNGRGRGGSAHSRGSFGVQNRGGGRGGGQITAGYDDGRRYSARISNQGAQNR